MTIPNMPAPLTLAEIIATRDRLRAGHETFTAALDTAPIDEQVAARFQKFLDSGGIDFPPAERRKVERSIREQIEAGWKERAGVEAFHLNHAVRSAEPALKAAVPIFERAPDPRTARVLSGWAHVSLNEETDLLLHLLAEQQRQRIEPWLRRARPAEVETAYRAALQDPYSQEHATLIRLVEQVHGTSWAGASSEDPAELQAVGRLRELIKATKASRIPGELHEALALCATGYAALEQARRLQNVHGVRPPEDPVSAPAPAGFGAVR